MPPSSSPAESTAATPPLIGVVLVGGFSSRMGRDKALLEWQGTPLYINGVQHLASLCATVCLSLRQAQLPLINHHLLDPRVQLLCDDTQRYHDIGPAAALLTAHRQYPTADLFVFACDFPLANTAACQQLVQQYHPPFTCFIHTDVEPPVPEPLFAIWSVSALDMLEVNVTQHHQHGPMYTLRQVSCETPKPSTHYVTPASPAWLWNTNTPEEWEKAKQQIQQQQLHNRDVG